MRKKLLLVFLLLSSLLLTGCYTDVNPWPSASTPPLDSTTVPITTAEPAQQQING